MPDQTQQRKGRDAFGSNAERDAAASAVHAPRDWFIGAIESDGNVAACLDEVARELNSRVSFVRSLRSALTGGSESGPSSSIDRVTEILLRIKSLETTLRFRMPLLQPGRPGPWFRAPVSRTTGPFSAPVIAEPVLPTYALSELSGIESGLAAAWHARSAETKIATFDRTPSLWRCLLQLGAQLEEISRLPEPYANLRLDTLPDGLPAELESRPLRAFLRNVRTEILSARERLAECHRVLHEACAQLWQEQRKAAPQAPPRSSQKAESEPNPWRKAAGDAREEFRKRRQSTVRPSISRVDGEALSIMGFAALPSGEELRQRFLTLAKAVHPDRAGGSEEKFKSLNRAYQHLSSKIDTLGS